MDIAEGTSLSSSEKISKDLSEVSLQSRGGLVQGIDPLVIINDLANTDSILRHRNSDLARPLSSMSEPTRMERDSSVPHKLVPSTSTERIMDILRERGLDVGGAARSSSAGERRGLLSESLEVVNEEVVLSSEEEEGDKVTRYPVNSSTPAAAVKSEDPLQAERRGGGSSEGMLSPAHLLFSVGSSPVHGGSSQDLQRRASITSLVSLPEGTYLGEARHKDGSLMSIVFQVRMWCVLTSS